MKLQNDSPQRSRWPVSSRGEKSQMWLCLAVFVAATVLPGAIAIETETRSTALIPRDFTKVASAPAGPAPAPSPVAQAVKQDLQFLPGAGGGADILEAEREEDAEGKSSAIYRPWKTRYDLQPYDIDSPKFLNPENRMAYRKFYASHPHLSLAPNGRDREAQSSVAMVFGLTCLGAIIGGVLIAHLTDVFGTDELSLISYQQKMLKVVIYASVPWLLLGGWLLNIFFAFVNNPMRFPGTDGYHWQCGAMVWFLLVAPAVNTLYFTVHALWISKLFFSVEKQAPMGRMFNLALDQADDLGNKDQSSLARLFNIASNSVTRFSLLFLEVACALFGYMLITFRGGANSQFCQPEVYWTTTALVAVVSIIIVFTALAFLCSVFLYAFSISPWIQDFVESFWEAEDEAAREQIDLAFEKAAEKAKAEAAEKQYEAEFDEWQAMQAEHTEARARHADSLDEHADYRAMTSQVPPQREQLPSATAFDEDTPLVVWSDDVDIDENEASDAASAVNSRREPLTAPRSPVGQLDGGAAMLYGLNEEEKRNFVGTMNSMSPGPISSAYTRAVQSVPFGPISVNQAYGSSPMLSGSLVLNQEALGIPSTSQGFNNAFGEAAIPSSFSPGMPGTGMPMTGMLPTGQTLGTSALAGPEIPFSATLPPNSLQGPLPPGSFQAGPFGSFAGPPGSFAGPPGTLPPSSFQGPSMGPGTLPLGSFAGPPGTLPPSSFQGTLPPGALPFGSMGAPPGTMPPQSYQGPFPPGTVPLGSFGAPPGTLPPSSFR